MAISSGSDILAADFISTSAGAADASKGVKLNASGLLDTTLLNSKPSDVDQSQTTENASTAVGEADATTKRKKFSQSFVAATNSIRGVALSKVANTGTFSGTVTVALQADSAGSPSGSNLASITLTNAQYLAYPVGEMEIAFTAEYATVIGTTYWIVISTSTSDNSNHPNLGTNSAGGYGSGSTKYNNTTDGWVAVATIDLYFKTLTGILSRIPVADATNGAIPSVILPTSFLSVNGTTTTANGTNDTIVTAIAVSKVMPYGFFKTNSGLRIKVFGTASTSSANDSANNKINVKINGTVVATTLVQSTASPQSTSYVANFVIMNVNSLSLQRSVIDMISMTGSTLRTQDFSTTTSSVDTSGVSIIELEMSSEGGNLGTASMTHTASTIEKISM